MEWNTHRISRSHNQHQLSPTGRPFAMYHTPELYNTTDYLLEVSEEAVEICKELTSTINGDEDVFELASILMEEKGLQFSYDPYDTLNIYTCLRREILNSL